MKKIFFQALAVMMAGAVAVSCGNSGQTTDNQTVTTDMKKAPYQKKYTNADFYDAQGNFKEDVAKAAFQDMFDYYDYPYTALMEKDIWFADFGLGDFENCGMGGIFWVNDAENNYFAHAIYLLPGQMIPEHRHVKTAYAPKMESWLVDKGWAYNFSEVGDATPDAPAVPVSQAETTISKNCVKQNQGELITLKAPETWHFLMAGPEGAIISEFANYHDGEGLRFTNPKAQM